MTLAPLTAILEGANNLQGDLERKHTLDACSNLSSGIDWQCQRQDLPSQEKVTSDLNKALLCCLSSKRMRSSQKHPQLFSAWSLPRLRKSMKRPLGPHWELGEAPKANRLFGRPPLTVTWGGGEYRRQTYIHRPGRGGASYQGQRGQGNFNFHKKFKHGERKDSSFKSSFKSCIPNKIITQYKGPDFMHGRGPNKCKQPPVSWKASTPHTELGSTNKGLLGAQHCTGVPDRVRGGASPEQTTLYPSHYSQEESQLNQEELQALLLKGAVTEVRNPRGGFYSYSPPKGRRSEASNKPKGPEPVRCHTSFQDGGYPYLERPDKTRGLDGKNRPEGCLLYDTHTHQSKGVSEVQIPGQGVPIQLPTLWSLGSPMGLYQDPEASYSSTEGAGGAVNSVHR